MTKKLRRKAGAGANMAPRQESATVLHLRYSRESPQKQSISRKIQDEKPDLSAASHISGAMARKSAAKKCLGASQTSGTPHKSVLSGTIKRYGEKESIDRLRDAGFHPNVSTLTLDDYLLAWEDMGRTYAKRPTRNEFVRGAQRFRGRSHLQSRRFTRGLLVFRPEILDDLPETGFRQSQEGNMLVKLLESPHVGGLVVEYIFAEGRTSVQNTALSCTRVWQALAANSNVYDLLAGDYRMYGRNGVFAVLTPEYIIAEFNETTNTRREVAKDEPALSKWLHRAKTHELVVSNILLLVHRRLESLSLNSPSNLLQNFDAEVISLVQELKVFEDFPESTQFQIKSEYEAFEAPAGYSLGCLQKLLKQIYRQRSSIRVLYFERTPFLDRRVLAIVLRSCPNVRMVGIYDCPLIHFGDVICLLDLIWEINQERQKSSLPTITGFDFRPRYHAGMPYSHDNAATYGLTWGARKREAVQRGFYLIILKAFMKAKCLRLTDTLFSKDKAFVNYLFRVPNLPFGVPSFLDSLWRYMELNRTSKDYQSKRLMVLYDLLKPVRMGLEPLDQDWPHWYINRMGRHMVACASCGYEMPEEFFTPDGRSAPPRHRFCAGCVLMSMLDREEDHCKKRKKNILSTLFPSWKGKGFNCDAPIPSKGLDLINLGANVAVHPSVPLPQRGGQEITCTLRYRWPCTREHKVHDDSLQDLPSLRDLVEGSISTEAWGKARQKSADLELYCLCIRILFRRFGRYHPVTMQIKYSSDDKDEAQPQLRPHADYLYSLDFHEAMRLHRDPHGNFW